MKTFKNNALEAYENSEKQWITEVEQSSSATRKNWLSDLWILAIKIRPDLMDEPDCPYSLFTPEQWIEIILAEPMILQYCHCPETLTPLLTKERFQYWGSEEICQAIFFGEAWLIPYLNLDKITQEDFDFYFGEENEKIGPEKYFHVMSLFFPRGIPSHLKLPYPTHLVPQDGQ